MNAKSLHDVLLYLDRAPLEPRQTSFLTSERGGADTVYYAGDLDILRHPSIAVVGARNVSDDGAARARRIARALAQAGATVVSGLAKGVDVNAHKAAIDAGGQTAAVIGTPLSQAYPAEHRSLQEEIARNHLLISPFPDGERVFQSNFPKRNRVMAALTDGTIIVEASDSSGTLHQAAECQRLGRWLFIVKSVFEDTSLKWPKTFAKYEKMRVVSDPGDVLGLLGL